MFNRFFKNKEDGKSGPPGHQRQSGGNGASDEPPVGGGFFNLPPPVAKPYNVSNSNSNATVPSNPVTAASGYPPPAAYNTVHTQNYGGPPAAPDMFGGMALKGSSEAKPVARFPSQAAGPNQYGGYANAPPATRPPGPSSGSLFTGLAVASVPSLPVSDDSKPTSMRDDGVGGMPPYGIEPRKASRSSGASPHLDHPNQDLLNSSRYSRTSTGSSAKSAKAAKKKKKKTFRPGFGRQLSDESAAALQRGDLNEDDVLLQQREGRRLSDKSDSVQRPRRATNPTDLAHLLPPVTTGSVLQGLTVHQPSSGSTTGVLAGLTVHKSASPAPSPPKIVAANDTEASGRLSGLMIHKMPTSLAHDSAKTNPLNSVVVDDALAVKTQEFSSVEATVPLTPEERLGTTLRDFYESAVGFRQLTVKQNDEEHRLLERKAHLANQLMQYELDLRDIEAQQHHACEVEDFEKADALNATINSVRHCITLTESDVRKVESEVLAFGKAKEKAFAQQLKSTRGTLRELEKFRDDQESDKTVARNEYKLYDLNQTQQLQFEAERIETEMHHVSVSLENVKAEKSEIEATIEGQCSAEFAVQARLIEEKQAVEEEVRELEQKLKEKLKRVKKIQSSIDNAQRDINIVRKRYSRQLKRIADREESIQKTKAEVEADKEHLEQQCTAFEARKKRYTDDISTIGKRIGAVTKEMRAAALLANVLEVQETRREQAMLRKKQQTAELSSLTDTTAVAEQSFTMLHNQQEELQKSLSLHRNAIASAEAMIPRLEQEKKGAAAQRNFKEAARISKDIKALEKDRSTAEEMVEVVEMELQDLKERIDKREMEFYEKKKELKEMEKHLELAALQELWKEAKHLRRALRKIERCKSEGDAATDGIDFRSSALLLVQAEYDACLLQVETLEKKYDVSDPAKDDSSEEEEEESSDGEEDDTRELVPAPRSSLTGKATDVDGPDADVETLEDRRVALEEITAQLAELESQIEQATENEEYDLAARLDEEIETLTERKQAIEALMPSSVVSENDSAEDAAEELDSHESLDEKEDDMKVEYSHAEFISPASIGRSQEEVGQTIEPSQLPAEVLENHIAPATNSDDDLSAVSHQEVLESSLEEERNTQSQLATDQSETMSSMFGGLTVKSNSSDSAEAAKNQVLEHESPHETARDSLPSENLFGGLQMSNGPAETLTDVATMGAADEVPEHEGALAPATEEVFSPTSSNMKDSFFGQSEESSHHASLVAPSASGSLFGGLHVSGHFNVSPSSTSFSEEVAEDTEEANVEECTEQVEASASDNMVGDLQSDSNAGAVETEDVQLSSHAVDETLSAPTLTEAGTEISIRLEPSSATSPTADATEAPSDMFSGLQLSRSAETEASVEAEVECPTCTEDASEELAGGDTRMSIYELSEHESKSAVLDLEPTTTSVVSIPTDTTHLDEAQAESGEDATEL